MSVMRRFATISLISLSIMLAASRGAAAQEKRPPNIVYILADDLGWTDLGCQGSKYYETPHIDRLAQRGMRLTGYYNSQNCAPTRAALLVGQYAPRTGVYTVGSLERGNAVDRKMDVPTNVTNLPLDRKTFADMLKDAGYATGMFGKWHLGNKGPYHPGKRGFDEAIVSMGKHFDFATQPKVEVPPGVYLADWLTDKAVDFIARHKDKPFFLYVPHFGVHSPHHAKKELIERFKKKAPAGGHYDPTYAAMIFSLDESVGRIVAKLEELKLTDNTIVIFSSDNGGVGGYQEIGGKGITSNLPLRGGKGMLYAGGMRVPFIIAWPGHTKSGSTCPTPTIHVDLFPTFLEMAGAKKKAPQVLDGESLVPLFKDAGAKLKRDAIYHHFPGYLEGGKKWRTAPAGFIQAGDWKLLEFFETGTLELYNLADDIGEKTNLAAKMPEKTKELHGRLLAWRKDVKAHMPTLKKTAESLETGCATSARPQAALPCLRVGLVYLDPNPTRPRGRL
jgi:arylsulfatase A-like enzyme